MAFITSAGTTVMRVPLLPQKGGKKEYDLKSMIAVMQYEVFLNDEVREDHFIVLEKQQAFPGQGVVSTFRTGEGFGIWQGILTGLELDYVIVPPMKWQGEVCPGKKGLTKERAIKMAGILFPETSLLPTKRSKKPHTGFADALCMAEYGRRIYKFHKATKVT